MSGRSLSRGQERWSPRISPAVRFVTAADAAGVAGEFETDSVAIEYRVVRL